MSWSNVHDNYNLLNAKNKRLVYIKIFLNHRSNQRILYDMKLSFYSIFLMLVCVHIYHLSFNSCFPAAQDN